MIDWDALLHAPVEGVFGQPATWTSVDGTTTAPVLNGVFDEAVRDVDVTDGVPVTSVSPCYGARLSVFPVLPQQGDTLFVPAAAPLAPLVDTTYIVREVRVDGHGWCLLRLNIAPASSSHAKRAP